MTNALDTEDRIRKLERDHRLLKAYSLILTAALVGLACIFPSLPPLQADQPGDRILRARGLIIEDEAGKERILLGAPVPAARNRVRTDVARVKELWAKNFPKEYMDWYKDYRHATNGLLILDENGFDRIALHDPVPDPNIGKRIGPSTGVVINDEQGFERSGYGLLKVQDRYRVALGMDSPKGREGLTLALFDEGPVGVRVADGERVVYLGSAPAKDGTTVMAAPFHGLLVRGADGIKFLSNAATEKLPGLTRRRGASSGRG
jgi:hypothetical protein